MLDQLLPPPLSYRKNIPLYYPKTEAEIKADSYEIYNPNVIRSFRNFYEGTYGDQLLNEITKYLNPKTVHSILELGCGTGYLIGNIASRLKEAQCVGLDYSYQMLKMASQVFKNNNPEGITQATSFQNGMSDIKVKTENLDNLSYALSDACLTPLLDQTIDFCFSCFLWDRVADPSQLLCEKIRITKPGGTIIFISPFNYLSEKGWKTWHPIENVIQFMSGKGLNFIEQNHFVLEELLDVRRNRVVWEVDSLVFQK